MNQDDLREFERRCVQDYPPAYEFALLDMAQSNSEECHLAKPAPGKDVCDRIFFPGCQLAASRGAQVGEAFRHPRGTLATDVGIWLGCCGMPAHWSGHEKLFEDRIAEFRRHWSDLGCPEIIAACPSCMEAFRIGAPDIPVVSLWEVLDKEAPPPVRPLPPGLRLTVNDPCTSRFDAAWRGSVRNLLRRHGADFNEPEFTGEKTSCCGYGGLVWNSNPEVADAMAKHRADDLPDDAISSCIMCRDRLAGQGKPSWHLLDVLWPDSGVDPEAKGVTTMTTKNNYTPDSGDWICATCQVSLEQKKMQIRYLESAFEITLPQCPACGQTSIPKSLAEGRMAEAEALLEDK